MTSLRSGSSPRTRGTCSEGPCAPDFSTVHPRARGEHAGLSADTPALIGSSPRTRGTLRMWRARDGRDRFIPAHAGNICSTGTGIHTRPVHPRARGEHGILAGQAQTGSGSSPRTRGTCRAQTPNFRACPVHPRARGEHIFVSPRFNPNNGSSPRTRGTLGEFVENNFSARFIPAHAGNIRAAARPARDGPVHPRARGEHFTDEQQEVFNAGSSPRTRGTFSSISRASCGMRFIPAHAGNIVGRSPR